MNPLRLNPQTGRLAERVPGGGHWMSWDWSPEGALGWAILTDDEVAGWIRVIVAPAPPVAEFAFALACADADCDGALVTSGQERDQLAAAGHAGHTTVPYAVRLQHPDNADGDSPTLPAGTDVTFHGSTVGDPAGLVPALIERAVTREFDGEPTDGYILAVDGHLGMFVPATAVRAVAP